MNYIFTGYNNTISPEFTLRNVEKIPASGATLLFSSTLIEKPRPPRLPSPFVSSLLQFIGILRVKYIPYATCEEITPWTMPRLLQVHRLPQPAFQSHPPARTFYPQIAEKDAFNPYPLIPDMKEEEPETFENEAAIMAYAESTLAMKGILEQDATGMVYLDIPANFAETLLPLIQEEGVEPSPIFVPVMLAHEAQEKAGLGPIKELGETFSFKLLGLHAVKPLLWPEIEKVYFLVIHAPGLDELREKYLLPGKIPLHMTLGIKREQRSKRPCQELYRLNVSCNAA